MHHVAVTRAPGRRSGWLIPQRGGTSPRGSCGLESGNAEPPASRARPVYSSVLEPPRSSSWRMSDRLSFSSWMTKTPSSVGAGRGGGSSWAGRFGLDGGGRGRGSGRGGDVTRSCAAGAAGWGGVGCGGGGWGGGGGGGGGGSGRAGDVTRSCATGAAGSSAGVSSGVDGRGQSVFRVNHSPET